ncbi:CBS domain-containing protein [Pelomicrobium methylotrophicum]|uniref:CBS domain-containing protein n=1 Tax=Pelomicrobium methylotrophicum TaxID=2602750 RepID=A0A5C7ESR5_9PROT|nr:CBS domain-containing protein [Pelomicrobium methylotrophicum]TXF10046.1 CBS domain-containing protein [Pelomicrobium methylotrophicum]
MEKAKPLAEVTAILKRIHIKRSPVMRDAMLVSIVSRTNLLHELVALKPQLSISVDDQEIRARVLEALRGAGLIGQQINAVVPGRVVQLWLPSIRRRSSRQPSSSRKT